MIRFANLLGNTLTPLHVNINVINFNHDKMHCDHQANKAQ